MSNTTDEPISNDANGVNGINGGVNGEPEAARPATIEPEMVIAAEVPTFSWL
jgi:hypothetical protein